MREASAVGAANGTGCRWASVELGGHADVRVVEAPNARVGERSVERARAHHDRRRALRRRASRAGVREPGLSSPPSISRTAGHVQAVHERWTGDGAGWDRWLETTWARGHERRADRFESKPRELQSRAT